MSKKLLLVLLIIISRAAFAYNLPASFPSSTMNTHWVNKSTSFISHHSDAFISREDNNQKLKTRLLEQYVAWKGTRYHMGGNSHRGVDCSALMQRLFSDSIQLSLPRTASEQMHRGKAISRGELKPGDLVFFQTGRDRRHVGVFIGDGEFIHASTSQGVTISSLNNEYWQAHYHAARRVTTHSVG